MWSSTLVGEFGDVSGAVRRPQQVGLRSSSEFAQVLDSGDAGSHKHLLCFGLGIETEEGERSGMARRPKRMSSSGPLGQRDQWPLSR